MQEERKDIHKIIIIGGGPAGLLAGLRLRQSNGISPIIYEIRDAPSTLGGAIGIPANGLRLLQQLGIYDEMLSKGALTSSLVVHDLHGYTLGELDMASWSEHQTGFSYLRIRRTDVMEVLLRAVEREKIPVRYGMKLTTIEEKDDRVTIHFDDGTIDTSDFLLGCDGLHSSVRKLYIDPEIEPEYTGISNMYSLVPQQHLNLGSGRVNGLNITMTSDGLFALSPTTMLDNLLYWFFSREVSLPESEDLREGWEEHGKREIESCKSMLLNLFCNDGSEWIDLLRQVITTSEVIKFYPIYKLPSGGQWFKGRCLLMGDAAHAMPPHASQGVSMALEDIFLFSKLLKSSLPNLHNGLTAYVQKRNLRIHDMLKRAESNSSVRRQIPVWRLRANSWAISMGLWVYKVTSMERLGMGQKSLVYNIEDEEF